MIEHLIQDQTLQQEVGDTSLSRIIELLKEIFDSYEATRDENDARIAEAAEFSR